MAVAGLQVLPGQLDQQTLTLGVTIFWFYLAVPVGALLMALVIVARRLHLDHPSPERPPASDI
jgi:TRAP-type C4-dicarboxylate transport system permease small subunit